MARSFLRASVWLAHKKISVISTADCCSFNCSACCVSVFSSIKTIVADFYPLHSFAHTCPICPFIRQFIAFVALMAAHPAKIGLRGYEELV